MIEHDNTVETVTVPAVKTMTVSIEVGGQFITTLMPQDAVMEVAFENGTLRGLINKRREVVLGLKPVGE